MSYAHLVLLYIGMIFGCGLLYFALSEWFPRHAPSIPQGAADWYKLLDCLYFSTITATSVGYGDITPNGISKVIAGIQSISSLFVFAILVSKPISHRQEAALYQMHQLTFDDVFTSVREGFFIIRRDFDHLINQAQGTGTLLPHAWENLSTAFRQGEVLFEEIPKFYDTERRIYVIDSHREELLLEAVERTLERLTMMLKTFDVSGIVWRSNEKVCERFDEFLTLAEGTVDNWQIWSPHPASDAFTEVQRKIAEIKTMRKNG